VPRTSSVICLVRQVRLRFIGRRMPMNCKNCDDEIVGFPRKGRCNRCSGYFYRTGRERPSNPKGGVSGPAHWKWKGDRARTTTKRSRARRKFVNLGTCEECGEKPATERHHKDEDTGNNARENLVFVCRLCHMKIDGRLEKLHEARRKVPIKPPKPCARCGKPTKPLRRGRCSACETYLRRNGRERPARLWK